MTFESAYRALAVLAIAALLTGIVFLSYVSGYTEGYQDGARHENEALRYRMELEKRQ